MAETTHNGWSRERMLQAMQRMEQLRARMSIPADELEELLEEHRREIGRGPLIDEDANPGADE